MVWGGVAALGVPGLLPPASPKRLISFLRCLSPSRPAPFLYRTMATPAKAKKKKVISGERHAMDARVYVKPDSSAEGRDQMQHHGKIVPMIKPKKNTRPKDWHKTAHAVLGFHERAQPKLVRTSWVYAEASIEQTPGTRPPKFRDLPAPVKAQVRARVKQEVC